MIYLVRHGRTEFNAEGRFQGHLDSPLTSLGIEQACRYGELLKGLIGDPVGWRLVSSPLGRAVHTAEIIAGVLGLDADFRRDSRLAEIGMGSWDGLTIEDIAMVSEAILRRTTRHDFFFHAPDGERYDAFAARLGEWLGEAVASEKPWIAVSHGVAGRVLRGLYARMEPEAAMKLDSPQDAIFRLAEGRIERIDCAPVSAALAFGGA